MSPWCELQKARDGPRTRLRARGVRRRLGQTRDQIAVTVEGNRWAFLGDTPEVAVCLVLRQHGHFSTLTNVLP